MDLIYFNLSIRRRLLSMYNFLLNSAHFRHQPVACARESNKDLFNYGYFDFINREVYVDEDKIKKIRSLNIFNIPECADCPFKYHCSGDCPDNRSAGNLTKCESIKNTFIEAINDFYNLKNDR
jgi:radical SAM protein with 4Fe4S-binding SPASM domain